MSRDTRVFFLFTFIALVVASAFGYFIELSRGNDWMAAGFAISLLIASILTVQAATDKP